MDEFLPIGTLVKLKSGGPVMTVTNIVKDNPILEFTWYKHGEYRIIKVMKMH